MRFKISQEVMSGLVARAQSVIERKSTRPILENILLSCSGNELTLSATSPDGISSQGDRNVVIVVPGREPSRRGEVKFSLFANKFYGDASTYRYAVKTLQEIGANRRLKSFFITATKVKSTNQTAITYQWNQSH